MTQHTWLNDPYLALGAQVRLRRNVDDLPFGPRLQEAQAQIGRASCRERV